MLINVKPVSAVVASLMLLSACQPEAPKVALSEPITAQASAVAVVEPVTEVVAVVSPTSAVAAPAVEAAPPATKEKAPIKVSPPTVKVEVKSKPSVPVAAPPVPVAVIAIEPKVAEVKPQVAGNEVDALALAKKNNCFACHAIDKKLVGPAWKDVAAKYRGDASAEGRIATKIAKGGSGVWGAVGMPSNSKMTEAERIALAKFVLNLK
jgi:cytochrome c